MESRKNIKKKYMAVKKICIGAANFGMEYGLNKKSPLSKKDVKEIFEFLKKERNIYIDTAANYKNSETIIGKYSNEKFKIITKINKIPRKVNNLEKWLKNQINTSCRKLNVKKIYGLLIHDTKDLRNKKKAKKIYKVFDILKKSKIIEKIGLSIYNPNELDLYLKNYNFEIVQAPLNIFDRRMINSGWLKKMNKKGVQFFARSIFLQGLLIKDIDKLDKFFLPYRKKFQKFDIWTQKLNISKVEACIRFVNSVKEVDKVIIGINSKQQFVENYNFMKKPKLIVPNSLEIKSGKILNPKLWKKVN